MIGVVVIEHRSPRRPWWKRRPKPSLREIGAAVAILQVADAMLLHANRDGCLSCLLTASRARAWAAPRVPHRLLSDPNWFHRHIVAPGTRIQARVDDRMPES